MRIEKQDYILPGNFHTVIFHLNGDTGQTDNMLIDGSGTPQKFWAPVPVGWVGLFYHLNAFIIGGANIVAGGFGAGSALTNGITIGVDTANGDETYDFTEDHPIRTNASFHLYGDVHDLGASRGIGFTWEIHELTGGAPILFRPGERIRATVQDDTRGAGTEMIMAVQGLLLDATLIDK